MTVFSHHAPRTKLPAKWKVGDVIAQLYEVLDFLGDAGMGSIYKVYHRGWNEVLVVRQPRASMFASEGLRYGSRLAARLAGHGRQELQKGKADQEAVLKFMEQVKGWVGLGLHPHIVPCYDVLLLGGLPHLFIDYMAGGSLTDWISTGRLYEGGAQVALARILDFAIQLAWGLQYAHDQGMVHRNLKPSNIMITPDEVVKISDFTLAEARVVAGEVSDGLGNRPGQSVIVPGVGLMTREYASPEQAVGQPLTPQSDLWSWGVILLEMFMGEVTWWLGTVVGAALESYLHSGASNPAIPAMPVALTALLKRCFEPNPTHRPAQMLDVARELLQIYKQAIWHEYPRTIPQLKPYFVDNRNNQALTLLDRGSISQADELWLEILNKVGRHLPSATNFGFLRWQRGQMTSEVLKRLLEEGIKGNEHIPWQTTYLLGLINLKLNEPRDALLSLEKAREQASEVAQVEAAYRLASYLLPVQQMGGVFDDELTSYYGHLLAVSAVTFSPDGHFALSGSDDGTLRLWQLETGRCIRLYEGHTEAITSLAIIEDSEGRTLALSGSKDGTLRLWDTTVQRQAVNVKLLPGQATGESLRVFSIRGDEEGHEEGHGDAIMSVAFVHAPPLLSGAAADQGQRWLALSGSQDKSLRLWDIETGKVEKVLKGHTGTVGALAVSRDGRFALSGADDKTVQLWELSTGRSIRLLQAHTAEVTAVAMLPPSIKMGVGQAWAGETEHEFALSGSNDGTLRLWNLTTGECLRVLGDNQEGHTEEVTSLSLSDDGRLALSGSWDETLRLWDVATGRCLHTFEGHLAEIRSVSISPDGHFILSGADDGTLRLWGIPPEHLQITAWCLARPIWYQGLPNSAKEVQRLLEEVNKQIEAENFTTALALLQKAREIPAYERSPQVLSVYERLSLFTRRAALRDGWLVRVFQGHTNQVTSVSLSADARFALSGSEDNSLRLWETATGRCLRIFKRHTAGVISVSLSPNGRLAISGSWDETVRLWDVETGRCLRTFNGHAGAVTSVHLSPDMRWGLSTGVDSTVRVWDLNSGRSLRVFEEPSLVGSACFSANGRFVLTGNMDYGVRLWDVTTGELLRTLKGHTKEVTAVSMSANNRFVLSGSLDHTLRLWDITTGHCLGSFENGDHEIYAVALSANGRWALSGSLDKTVRIWDMQASLTNQTRNACIHTFKRGSPGVEGGGHFGNIRSVAFSADGHWVLSGSRDGTLRLWRLDWELQANQATNWDANALWAQRVRPYLDNFLTLHTPYAASTPFSPEDEESDDDLMQLFMREGKPTWNEEEFQAFIRHLQEMGYGWIRPDSLRATLAAQGSYISDKGLPAEATTVRRSSPEQPEGETSVSEARHAASSQPTPQLAPQVTITSSYKAPKQEGLEWDASQIREPDAETITSEAKKVGAAKVERKEGQNGQLVKGRMRARTRQIQKEALSARRLLPTTELSAVYKRVGIKDISLVKPFEGHIEGVKSVCLTADGRFAVSASWDKTLRLWDTETGRTVRVYEGHDDGIYAVSLITVQQPSRPQPSPPTPVSQSWERGDMPPLPEKMLSASRDGSLRLWDIETGEILRLFEGHTGEVRCLSVSPDGRWVLSGSDDKSIRLWDIASGRCLRIFEGHSDSIRALSFSADGQRFLSGSRDKTMRLWELATHRCLRTFEGHTGWVTGVAMSPDKRLVYSASDDKSIGIWEANSGRHLKTLEGHTNWLTDIELSSDGRFLLSAAWDNTIRLWDVKTGEQLRIFPTVEAGGHRGVINSVTFSNNAQFVLSGSYDGTLRFWKLEWLLDNHMRSNWDPVARCYLENFLILQTPYLMPLPAAEKEWSDEEIDMALTRRGEPSWEDEAYEVLLVKLRDAGLGFIAPETVRIQLERLVSTPKLLSGNTQRFRALPGGKQDTGIRTGLRKATLVKTLHGHTASISSISLSRQDKPLVLSGSWDNRLLLWDIAATEPGSIGSFEGHTDKIHSAMLTQSASGELLALSGSRDHTMRLWQLPNGQEPRMGRELRLFEGHSSDIQAISISPDGRFALSGSDDSTLRLWEVATGQQLRILKGHSTPIRAVCFSHDGRFALSGSGSLFLHDDSDNNLRLWDVATGECLRIFGSQAHKKEGEDEVNKENQENQGHRAAISAISISTDNRFALSGSHDNSLCLWNISTGEWLRTLEGHSEAVTSACISYDGKFALSGSRDGTMRLWDLSTGACLHTFKGHIGVINAVNISPDGNYALSGGYDSDLRLWKLEWDYEPALAASWDESALPYLETFLTLRTPYRAGAIGGEGVSDEELINALSRAGDVSWTEEDFQQLLVQLRHAGYGWLDPKGVRSELEHLSESWFEPPPLAMGA